MSSIIPFYYSTIRSISEGLKENLEDLGIETRFLYKLLNLNKRVFYIRRLDENFIQAKLPNGYTLVLPRKSFYLIDAICFRKSYTKLHKIRSKDIVIDVGSHVGTFALCFLRKMGKGLVVAVEPHPFNYRLLTTNLAINKISNVVPMNVALTNTEGNKKLYIGDSESHSIKMPISDKYLEVQATTLDHLADQLKLKKVDLIKINAEASELDILQGGDKTLRKTDALAISCSHTPEQPYELSAYLKNKGFNVVLSYDRKNLYASRISPHRLLN